MWSFFFSVLTLVCPAPAAEPFINAESRALLIDDQLATRSITVVSLDDRVLSYVDEQQRQRTLARPTILALIPDQSADHVPQRNRPARASTGGILELTNGERFEGDLFPTGGTDQMLAWRHPTLGQLTFPIERTAFFWRPGAPEELRVAPASDLKNDTLFLNNQDQLSGFLASAGDPIRIETEAGITDLPPERVIGATLANPQRPPSGTRLWLEDGSVAVVSRLVIDASLRSTFAIEQGAVASINWTQLRGVLFNAARLRSLSAISPVKQMPSVERRFAPPIRLSRAAPLDAQDILLPGPMSVTWTLPEGSRRIAFTAALAEGTTPWGDCEVVVSIDGNELTRRRLSTDSPSVPITVAAAGRALSIKVDPGKFGPIRDWVVLTRPLILIDAPADSTNE